MDNLPNAQGLPVDQYVHAIRMKLQSYHCEFVHVYEPSKIVLPMLLSIDAYDHISNNVTLIDLVGNEFEVVVEKQKSGLLLTQGTEQIGPYYKLFNGGWLTFIYLHEKLMLMEVKDRLHEHVVYPTPVRSFYVGDSSNPINLDNDNLTYPPHPIIKVPEGSFHHCLVLNLEVNHVQKDELHLSGGFVENALNRTLTSMNIVDDSGKLWPCKIKWDKNDPSRCKVTSGWLKFVKGRGVKAGTKICLGLPLDAADHIYFKFV